MTLQPEIPESVPEWDTEPDMEMITDKGILDETDISDDRANPLSGITRMSRQLKPEKEYLIRKCPEFVSTGFSTLDKLLGGGLTSNLIVLGAISSLGKSTLLLQMAQNIAPRKPVLFFSLEMSAYRHAEKSVIRQLHLNAKKKGLPEPSPNLLTNPELISKLDEGEWNELKSAIDAFNTNTQQLFILDRSQDPEPFNVLKIRRCVMEFYRRTGTMPVVIVDYLQLLRSNDSSYSGTERQLVDYNVAVLWRMAHFMGGGTPVVVISSINRESYSKPISFAAFKESGGIEFSADIVLGMQYRNVGADTFNLEQAIQENPRKLELVLLKNRYGPSQEKCYLDFEPAYSNFTEVAKEKAGIQPSVTQEKPAGTAGRRSNSSKSYLDNM